MTDFVSVFFRAALILGFALLLGTATPNGASQASAGSVSPSLSEAVYTLHLGSYVNVQDAEFVAADIAGAWIQAVSIGQQQVYRVNVGRYFSRTIATRARCLLRNQGILAAIQELYKEKTAPGQRA